MSAKLDNLEVTTSVIVGGLINYGLTMLIFGVSHTFAAGTTILFFCVSYARSYVIRRIFRKIGERE